MTIIHEFLTSTLDGSELSTNCSYRLTRRKELPASVKREAETGVLLEEENFLPGNLTCILSLTKSFCSKVFSPYVCHPSEITIY
jgi:hypothetical protein